MEAKVMLMDIPDEAIKNQDTKIDNAIKKHDIVIANLTAQCNVFIDEYNRERVPATLKGHSSDILSLNHSTSHIKQRYSETMISIKEIKKAVADVEAAVAKIVKETKKQAAELKKYIWYLEPTNKPNESNLPLTTEESITEIVNDLGVISKEKENDTKKTKSKRTRAT